jgi:hypothetical protein
MTIQHHNPEDHSPCLHHCENLRSQTSICFKFVTTAINMLVNSATTITHNTACERRISNWSPYCKVTEISTAFSPLQF